MVEKIGRLKNPLTRLLRSSFAQSVAVLTGGTVFAQGIGVLALPFLTRLYTPDDFGVMGSFAALLGIISVVSALRYQIAIPLPEDEQEAANLLLVSLACVAVTSTLTALAVAFVGELIVAQFTTPALGKVLWLLPIGVLVTGSYAVFQYWATRKKAYSEITKTRIEQAVSGIVSKLTLGWVGTGAVGLVLGQIMSNGAGFLGLAQRAWSEAKEPLGRARYEGLRRTAYVYRRFPMYSSVESLANAASLQLPLILIATLAGNDELGFLMLVMQILQGPMSLVGGAVAQVYYGQAAEELKSGRLLAFTLGVLKKLFVLGFPLVLLIVVTAPWVTPLLFGPSWERSGQLIIWLAPFLFIQFLSSPVSLALHVVNLQATALVLQLFGLFFRTAAVIYFPENSVYAFAISSALFYLIYLFVIIAGVRRVELHATPTTSNN